MNSNRDCRRKRQKKFEQLEDRRLLATIMVTTGRDVIDSEDGLVSLREAIVEANDLEGPDQIQFESTIRHISLSSSLQISESTTIGAAGRASVSVFLSLGTRFIDAIPPEVGVLEIRLENLDVHGSSSITISKRGGLIRFDTEGTLTLVDTVLSEGSTLDQGGAIASSRGDIVLIRSTLRDNRTRSDFAFGGAIHSDTGDITLIASTIDQNRTTGYGSHGGGISSLHGEITIIQSTVSNNRSDGQLSYGGGVFSLARRINIQNSTISGNSSSGEGGGGIASFRGQVIIDNSTITENVASQGVGGGVFLGQGGFLSVENSILASNRDNGIAPDLAISSGDLSSLDVSFSLIGDATGSPFALSNDSGNVDSSLNGNLVGGLGREPIDPGLGPLGDHGGLTQTHPLVDDSIAINAASPDANEFDSSDQRAGVFARVADGMSDMGAYERQILSRNLFVVTTEEDSFDYSDSEVSIREAVNNANGSIGEDEISFSPEISQIDIINGELTVAENAIVRATAEQAVTIEANQSSRLFLITEAANHVQFEFLNITGGYAEFEDGGGILSNSNGSLELRNVSITNNSADRMGGGIYSFDGDVRLTDSVVSGNEADGVFRGGGGIYLGFGDDLTVSSSIIENNISHSGGGIESRFANVTVLDSILRNNRATSPVGGSGGAIESDGGNVTIFGSKLENNIAQLDGGAVRSSSGDVIVESTSIEGNSAILSGGGISTDFGDVVAIDSVFNDNAVTGRFAEGGGAISISLNGDVKLTNSTISGNYSSRGGGGIYVDFGAVEISNSTITENTAAGSGGGIKFGRQLASTATSTITNSIIANNFDGVAAPDLGAEERAQALELSFSILGDGKGTPFGESPLIDGLRQPGPDGNLIGGSESGVVDPRLDPLADNGGPTLTHLLQNDSPAIDAGDPNLLTTDDRDQRGLRRIVGSGLDIGAVEQQVFSKAESLTLNAANLAKMNSGEKFRVEGDETKRILRIVGGDVQIDLTESGNVAAKDFDAIDLSNPTASQVRIDVRAIRLLRSDEPLVLVLEAEDDVEFLDAHAWRAGELSSFQGRTIRHFENVISGESLRIDSKQIWTNPILRSDVDNNGEITAIDALKVINEIRNRRYSSPFDGLLDDQLSADNVPHSFYDQNGDGMATSIDALRVVNALARQRDSYFAPLNEFSLGESERIYNVDLRFSILLGAAVDEAVEDESQGDLEADAMNSVLF